jgi:SagB-type dehydrogenase family enzyme
MGTAHDYLSAILQRGRVPMEPKHFEPDWRDSPRRAKHYPAAERLPLPASPGPASPGPASLDPASPGTASPGPADAGPIGPPGLTLPLLSDLLRHSYGYLGRRLAPHANSDLASLPTYRDANWWRGTASGGGLYPVSVYWVSGPRGPVLPGVYHYVPHHHEMRRLLAGDVTAQVRSALLAPGPADIPDTDQYLVLGVKYWQNSFKYNSFCFHAVTMDVGTVVHTWQLLAAERGIPLAPLLWFDDQALGDLLGATPRQEGIFAVLPLPWADNDARDPGALAAAHPACPPATARTPAVRQHDSERSRRVIEFQAVLDMHQATSAAAGGRPRSGALAAAAAFPPRPRTGAIELPAPRPGGLPVHEALRARRSSFGRFAGEVPTEPDDLAAVLDGGVAAAAFPCDVTVPAGGAAGAGLVKFYVFANHVRDVPPGGYEYDPARRRLLPVDAGPPGLFLQSTYFLENYNLEQAGAVLISTIRAAAVLDAVGDRGYRLSNALIGAVAQGVYTAAARIGLGCGAALGFDNVAYSERLRLTETDEVPLLIVMVGQERALPGDYVYRIA